MSCLEAGHILSNGPKTTSLCFSSVATSITCGIPAETEFRNSAKTTRVRSSVSAVQTFSLLLMVNFNPHQFTIKFALFTWLFSVWGWLVVTLWLADFFARLAAFDLAAVFWPDFWTSPANPAINSPFSCLRRSSKVRPKEEMKFRAWNIKSLTVYSLNLIYVAHVRPPKLLWCKCRDICGTTHDATLKK